LDSKKLKKYLSIKHNKPASNIKKKYELVMEYLIANNLDILFLQEAGCVDWGKYITRNFGWVRGGDSVIIYRKNRFGQMNTHLLHQYK
jgi:hypothetical protein